MNEIYELRNEASGFNVTFCFDLYVPRPDTLEAKSGSCQWENLTGIRKKETQRK